MSTKDLKSARAQMRKKVAPFKSQNNAIAEAIIAISEAVETFSPPPGESEAVETKTTQKSSKKVA